MVPPPHRWCIACPSSKEMTHSTSSRKEKVHRTSHEGALRVQRDFLCRRPRRHFLMRGVEKWWDTEAHSGAMCGLLSGKRAGRCKASLGLFSDEMVGRSEGV